MLSMKQCLIITRTPEPSQYPPLRAEVTRGLHPTVLASPDIIHETLQLLLIDPQTLQVRMSVNRTRFNLLDTVAGYNQFNYPRHWELGTPLHHQP